MVIKFELVYSLVITFCINKRQQVSDLFHTFYDKQEKWDGR